MIAPVRRMPWKKCEKAISCSEFQESESPPWKRRGGRDINKNVAKPPLMKRTGWLVQLPIIRWLERTTPSAPADEASRYLIGGAATPPSLRRGLSLSGTLAAISKNFGSGFAVRHPSSRGLSRTGVILTVTMRRLIRSLSLLLLLPAFHSVAQQSSFVPVTDEMLQNPNPADWLMWRRTLNGWGYSPLDQINRNNVRNLKMIWTR